MPLHQLTLSALIIAASIAAAAADQPQPPTLESLQAQVAALRHEKEALRRENFKLKQRIAELEAQLQAKADQARDDAGSPAADRDAPDWSQLTIPQAIQRHELIPGMTLQQANQAMGGKPSGPTPDVDLIYLAWRFEQPATADTDGGVTHTWCARVFKGTITHCARLDGAHRGIDLKSRLTHESTRAIAD